MSQCPVCHRALRVAQYNEDQSLKSCPECSGQSGQHVFYSNPSAFGVSDKRATPQHPEGIQSWCNACRDRGSSGEPITCSHLWGADD